MKVITFKQHIHCFPHQAVVTIRSIIFLLVTIWPLQTDQLQAFLGSTDVQPRWCGERQTSTPSDSTHLHPLAPPPPPGNKIKMSATHRNRLTISLGYNSSANPP
jgi:hypothetical protein